jgi:hypothetical protein
VIGDLHAPETLVLTICEAPLLGEALGRDLDGIAVVRGFPAGRDDARGLVRHVEPDAVVVDCERTALELESAGVPLVHVLLREGKVRALRADGWHEFDNADDSVAVIRNILMGELYAVAAHRHLASEDLKGRKDA